MTSIIIIGHGAYGTMIEENLKMLVGEIKNFYYLDFKIDYNTDILREKINQIIIENKLQEILFACDLTGGTPFREACILATQNDNYIVVGGLNTAAYCEMAYNLHLNPRDLANLGINATKESIMIFPN